jgi:hypothetical protein
MAAELTGEKRRTAIWNYVEVKFPCGHKDWLAIPVEETQLAKMKCPHCENEEHYLDQY